MELATHLPLGQRMRGQFDTNFLDCIAAPALTASTETLPRHSVVVLKESVLLEPNLLPHDLLSGLLVVELKETLTAEELGERCRSPAVKAIINEMLTETAGPSLKASKLKNWPSRSLGKDIGMWKPTLGENFRFSISQIDLKHRSKQQYLTLYSGNPGLEKELLDYAAAKSGKNVKVPYSIGEFCRSNYYVKANQLAQRNLQRAASQLAAALGVEIALQKDSQANAQPVVLASALQPIHAEQPLQAVPLGLSMFNQLVNFEYLESGAHYRAVGIYTDCGCLGTGQGAPVFPINPFDGIGMVSGFRSELHQDLPSYNRELLATAVPCGGPILWSAPQAFDKEDLHYIKSSLASGDCQPIEPTHTKLARQHPSKSSVIGPLQAALPEDHNDVRVMWHVFSTV